MAPSFIYSEDRKHGPKMRSLDMVNMSSCMELGQTSGKPRGGLSRFYSSY